jgi:threonine dehydratase
MSFPITIDDVRAAATRVRHYLATTPLRSYPLLDATVGKDIRALVKHENHQPTGAFKVRNGLSALTALGEAERRRGVVAATRGNHGLGLAWAGRALGVPVTVCVPVDNNPEKNDGIRSLGATLIEEGRDYDEAAQVAARLVRDRGFTLVHATNDRSVLAGAGTIALEMLEQEPGLEALVLSVGGGSQAVGALTVARALKPSLAVYAVQAEGASAIHDSWHAGEPRPRDKVATFADGIATRGVYEMTFPALREGLAGFVVVSDNALAAALRLALRTTHNLVEGAGAAGVAGLLRLREALAGKKVGLVFSGANIDEITLRRVINREI